MSNLPSHFGAGQFSRARPLTPEQLAAARSRSGLRAPGAAAPVPALELAALQAAVADQAAIPAPVTATAIGAAVRAVLGERVDNAKLHEADIPERIPAPELGAVRSNARKVVIAGRQAGEPTAGHILAVFGALCDFTVAGGRGYCRQPMDAIGTATDLCVDTVARAIRALQRLDLVDVANTIVRRVIDGMRRMVRGANLYLLRRPSQAPVEARPDQPLPTWQERTLDRWGRALRLWPSRNLRGFTARPSPT